MSRVILTDIEGTTSSISFVKQVLFPYARRALPAFVRRHGQEPQVRKWLDAAALDIGGVSSDNCIVDILQQWIDEDRKATPLKALQGMIWRQGYEAGELSGHVYADTPVYLRRWHQAGIQLYVYSSGSVEAQKLIFGHSDAGDLRPLFAGYFDTRTGGKRETSAYVAIALLGGPRYKLLVSLVFDSVTTFRWPRAAALSFALLFIALVIAALIQIVVRPQRVQGKG